MNACAAAPVPDAGIDDHIQSVSGLSDSLLKQLRQSLQKIDEINRITRIISMNARIEAVRIGAAGRSFGVIAEEMDTLSRRVSDTAQEIDRTADRTSTDLRERLDRLQTDVRRTRLTDLALANIDLIDRNLYERSCDVRWWATDAAVVAATLNGYCEKGKDIRVILKGGELKIHYTDERVLMTGKAEKVYDGVVEV